MQSLMNDTKDYSSGINFLEQNFHKLPLEGKSRLKDYLQSLVSLQNTMKGVEFADSVNVSLIENQGGN